MAGGDGVAPWCRHGDVGQLPSPHPHRGRPSAGRSRRVVAVTCNCMEPSRPAWGQPIQGKSLCCDRPVNSGTGRDEGQCTR
eukprot:scaffold24888_cov140-Isochrysis_galbana.AAC.1